MTEPRPEKVAVVEEVKQKFTDADGAMLTEYRGLDVRAIAELRRALRDAGGEYKIYKNTLVRRAAADLGLEIEDHLSGPTAIAFVGERPDGSAGDVAAVAKALKDFAKTNDALVLKAGLLDESVLDPTQIDALAELPSREVLLAQLAGAFQAPMAKFAGLLAAVPRDFAYALQALIDKGGAGDAEAAPAADDSAEAVAEAADDSAGDAGDEPAGDAGDEAETEEA
jgi:large subunit ribosomal protein L10